MITIESVRKLALACEGATEEPHFEKSSFRINKKIFMTLDAINNQVVVKLSPEEQGLFCSYNKNIIFPVKGAWGKKGYTTIELSAIPENLFKEILITSYRLVSGKIRS